MLALHTESTAGGAVASGAELATFGVGVAVLLVLAYDAYRRRGEWLEEG